MITPTEEQVFGVTKIILIEFIRITPGDEGYLSKKKM
jgi:hypothetical protein